MLSSARKLFVFAFFLGLVVACKDRARQQSNSSREPSRKGAIPRNISIRPAEAYSDLFLDSSTLESFISRQNLNDTLALYFRNFYNNRNFQFAWFNSDGLTEQTLAFSSLYNYSKDSSIHRKWLDGQLDSLQKTDTLAPQAKDPFIVRTELQMTWRFINYLNRRYAGEHEKAAALLNFIPVRKRDPMEMAKSILSDENDKTMNPWYDDLKSQLQRYVDLAAAGAVKELPHPKKSLKKGVRAPLVSEVKRRLALTGEMTDTKDTSTLFDEGLRKAIRAFQAAHGQKPDGRIQASLIRALNVPPIIRIRQILMNLQRMLWMPPADEAGKDRLIVVNIPEFELHVLDDQRKVFDMNIVVGKEGHSTVLFSGLLDRISLNPYWNIPKSIVVKEILPEMEKNKDYLQEHEMEITGEKDGIPVIRQLPGEKNELGKIKFLFPNSFSIYLHDTPHKDLFAMTERAFSHGCIRVADARKLALYLLQPMPDWDEERLDSMLTTQKEQTVWLRDPVPVLICYFTCWKSDQPILEFRKDIYGHDEQLARRLFRD